MGNHKICYPMTDVEEINIEIVTVPSGGLNVGDVVVVNTIDNSIADNFTQYVATKPTTTLLATEELGIVISGGNYETLLDGRMPDGNPDYTTYTYYEGRTAPVLILNPRIKFYLSDDCLADAATANQYLYGQNNSNTLAAGNSVPNDILTVAKVVAKHDFRLGGQFGGEFASGNVCLVLPYNRKATAPVVTYTVSFDTDGGSTVADQTVEAGQKATKPADPTKAGYNFKNWYADAEFTTVFDFDNAINANTTIYAKWAELFTVTFNVDGGSAVASQEVEDGGLATAPSDPTKDGYTFGGWYKEDTLTTAFDFATDTITADTTIYAKWTEE